MKRPSTRATLFCTAGLILAFAAGVAAYFAFNETTSGTVPNLPDLADVFRGGSSNFIGYPQRSVIKSFPFAGRIAWRRHQMRSQIHLSGQTDINRLSAFLNQPTLISIRGEKQTTFIARERGVYVEGVVEMATEEAKIVCLATESGR